VTTLDDQRSTVRIWGNDISVSVCRGNSTAPPVLLCMGFGGWLELWAPLRQRLAADGLTTIAFDVPGTGASDVPLLPLPLAAHALLALRLLDRLHIRRASVLGLSWGGLLAQQLAIMAPSRISRVVLASTNYGLGSIPGSWRRTPLLGAEVDPPIMSAPRARPWRRRGAGRGRTYQLVSLMGWTSLPWLPLMRQPTLVVAGDRDRSTPLLNSRIIAKATPRARLHVVPGGSHTMLLDRPGAVAPEISSFLRYGR
jgi:pimeloyl-ACP methyl ester carboxylesterase